MDPENPSGQGLLDNDSLNDSAPKKKGCCGRCCAWTRRNIVFLFLFFLGVFGIAIALYFLSQPCVFVGGSYGQPIRMMMSLDGSGSIQSGQWVQEKNAAKLFIEDLQLKQQNHTTAGNLSVGVIQFSSAGRFSRSATPYDVTAPMSRDIDGVLRRLANDRLRSGGTWFAPPLVECYNEIMARDAGNETFKMCVLITDGDNANEPTYTSRSGAALKQTTDFCAQHSIQPCTALRIADAIKAAGVKVTGVYVGSGYQELLNILHYSSCENVTRSMTRQAIDHIEQTCPYVGGAASFAQLDDMVTRLSEKISTQVKGYTDGICFIDPSFYYFFLLLLPALLWLLLRPLCILYSKRTIEQTAMVVDGEVPDDLDEDGSGALPYGAGEGKMGMAISGAGAPGFSTDISGAGAPGAAKPKPRRRKWSVVQTGRYIFAGQPQVVDFGTALALPPSAVFVKQTWGKQAQINKRNARLQALKRPVSFLLMDANGDRVKAATPKSGLDRMLIEGVSSNTAGFAYDDNELQPGDIEYEYTMCLMRCCPCLRLKRWVIKPSGSELDPAA